MGDIFRILFDGGAADRAIEGRIGTAARFGEEREVALAPKKRIGIVLFQLGGPDSLQAVEPFLMNLFLDPDIIPLGAAGFLRWPIAKLISSRRSIPVAKKY